MWENGPRPAGSPSLRGSHTPVCCGGRRLRGVRGHACRRRGAAEHPSPGSALQPAKGGGGNVTCARVGNMPATCCLDELGLGRCEMQALST